MKLFGRKQKESPPEKKEVIITGSGIFGLNNYISSEYSNELDAYARNYALYACISKIAQAVGGIEFLLFNSKGQIEDHPVLDVLYYPNHREGSRSFYQKLATQLLLFGNSYVYIAKVNSKAEMYLLQPNVIQIEIDSLGEVKKYIYRTRYFSREFSPDEICHIKIPNPGNDYYGFSYYEPIKRIIDLLGITEKWNLKLINNDMRPAGVLEYEGAISEDQEKEFKRRFRDMFQGAMNAGENIFLKGGVKWKPISISAKDADWLNLIKTYTRQISNVLNIPSELMGDAENKTYSNVKEARRAFYMEMILPLADFIIDEFNRSVVPKWGSDLWVEIDRSKIEAIQDDIEQKARIISQMNFLTINEKRIFLGYEPIDGGDVIMGSMADIPLISVRKSDKKMKTKELQKEKRYISFWQEKEKKDILWKSYKRRVDRQVGKYESTASIWVREITKKIISEIKKEKTPDAMVAKLDEREVLNSFLKTLRPLYEDGLIAGFKYGERAAKSDIDFFLEEKQVVEEDLPVAWRRTFETIVRKMMFESGTQISKTIIEQIKKLIRTGEEENLTVNQIAEKIWGEIQEFSAAKSRLWAITETTKIDNFGQLEGYKESGVEKKGWLCSMIPTSRPEHIEADEKYSQQPIRLDEDFIIGSSLMAHPGDPRGGPEQVCNCYCTLLPFVEEEE
jgi:phage portal protein, HK97 family